MKVARIGHATLLISTDKVRCLMDPVFVEPFDAHANRFDPPVDVQTERLNEQFDLIFISHPHMDHFCVRSLNLVSRDKLILFPQPAQLIENALRRMGFKNAVGVPRLEQSIVEDLTIMGIPNAGDPTEMGVLFRANGLSCWNQVDTFFDENAAAFMGGEVEQLDLLLAPYQPIVELPLSEETLGSPWPFEKYGRLIKNVLDLKPRCVVPASCGYSYVRAPWLNDRGFPCTEDQFIEDVRSVDPEIQGRLLPHGAELDVATHELSMDALSFATRRLPMDVPSHDWRPDRGVAPLRDKNALGYAQPALREQVQAYLEGPLLQRLADPQQRLWRQRMARMGVVWRLEVVHPDGVVDTHYLDLRASDLKWQTLESIGRCYPKIHTSITASGLLGLLEGELNTYSILFGHLRIWTRLYQPHRAGVHSGGDREDEPLTRVLLRGGTERYLERQLQKLGL